MDAVPGQPESFGYTYVREITETGMSRLQEYRDREGNRIAIKRRIGTNRDSTQRFAREIESMIRHANPFVMPILAHGDDWYSMPFADMSLADIRVPVDTPQAVFSPQLSLAP